MKHPLISIITVCYNSEKYIKDTIESVLKQTYQNFQYIIIDGGSTDRTLEIIKKYMPKFNGKMKWISEKDKGIYDAMNKGINLAKGDLIGIINSDDWYNSTALETIINNYDKDVDIYYGDIYIIKKIDNHFYIRRRNGNKLNLIKIKASSIPHPSCFVKTSWYRKLKYDTKYKSAADYKFILESFVNGANFKYIYFPFSFMRYGGFSIINRAHGQKETNCIRRDVLNEKTLSLKYMLRILIGKFYKLRMNIAYLALPKSMITKIIKNRGWEIYKD